jgi:phosphoribosylformylglycinamidine synthase II
MWNEHCSYKSSKKWLRTLPTEGPQVICGPGENAGIVDIGDGQAVVFKMESHNHPSYIEPTQGAATGVGGILRDVFTMGARPIAAMNALSFGEKDHPKTRSLVHGVVEGIGGYGNCFGVPTIGGETRFHPAYNGNCLVNAFAAGLMEADKIFYSAASGVGMPVVYLGAKTGRDGVGGATMASAEFDDTIEEKRPTVQVGDPFTEKRLLEACLELMATGAVISIQDMGAAGLTCSAVEMGDKGGLGIQLTLDHVPQREDAMTAYEMMLSESQERMLMVLRPEKEAEARAVFEKWDLDFAIVGETIPEDRFVIVHGNETVADLPLSKLSSEAPEYDRPWVESPPAPELDPVAEVDPIDALKMLIASPNYCSRAWIYEQYDYTVMADTIRTPGAGAGIVRVHGTDKALAFTSDVTPRYVRANPVEGGKQAVAEAFRNLCAVGAKPLATTDNLNFGNPEKPEIMGQFVGAIKGHRRGLQALDMPIVSGNVSLYNETDGQAILPTPTIGAVGLLENLDQMIADTIRDGHILMLVGETAGPSGPIRAPVGGVQPRGWRRAACGPRRRTAQRRFHPRERRVDQRLHRPQRRGPCAGGLRDGRGGRCGDHAGGRRYADALRRGSGPLPDRHQLRQGGGADGRRWPGRGAHGHGGPRGRRHGAHRRVGGARWRSFGISGPPPSKEHFG